MAVAIAALVVALGGDAFALIPGPDGMISSCYSNTNGALRVVDRMSTSCARGETAVRLVPPAGLDFERPYFSFRPGTGGGVTVVSEGGIRSITRLASGKYCVRPIANFDPIAGDGDGRVQQHREWTRDGLRQDHALRLPQVLPRSDHWPT